MFFLCRSRLSIPFEIIFLLCAIFRVSICFNSQKEAWRGKKFIFAPRHKRNIVVLSFFLIFHVFGFAGFLFVQKFDSFHFNLNLKGKKRRTVFFIAESYSFSHRYNNNGCVHVTFCPIFVNAQPIDMYLFCHHIELHSIFRNGRDSAVTIAARINCFQLEFVIKSRLLAISIRKIGNNNSETQTKKNETWKHFKALLLSTRQPCCFVDTETMRQQSMRKIIINSNHFNASILFSGAGFWRKDFFPTCIGYNTIRPSPGMRFSFSSSFLFSHHNFRVSLCYVLQFFQNCCLSIVAQSVSVFVSLLNIATNIRCVCVLAISAANV